MNLSTQLLRAFTSLEESLHFTQAAERCNLTQSAFSQAIRRLEAAVGVRLFDRDTRSVRLTPEGRLFAQRARSILRDIDAAVAELRDHASGKAGTLSLAIIPSLAASWLPRILDEYARRHPGVAIKVFDTYPERGLQLLGDGTVELVIATEPGDSGEFDVRSLFREPFLLACPARHPIARLKTLQLRHFAGLPMMYPIHIDNTRVVSGQTVHRLRPFLQTAGVVDTAIEVEQLASLTALIGAGMGVTVVPLMSRGIVTSDGVALVPIARSVMMREVYLVRRSKQSLSIAAQGLVEVIDRDLAQMRL